MKTIPILSVALTLVAAAPMALTTGCESSHYGQSMGEYIDDKATTDRVDDALDKDPIYKYSDVKVSTLKGTVQLSGFVATADQKQHAADVAKKVQGVKDIVNNITVQSVGVFPQRLQGIHFDSYRRRSFHA